jgi:hypothetical protein
MKDPGYCINDEVEMINDSPRNQPPIKAGTRFRIRDFPPCTIKVGTKFNYFLYGKTSNGIDVRAFIEEVKRIQ